MDWLRFGTACVLIVVVWLFVLPNIGARPGVQSAIRQQERLGIDPSAMFYTELEVMSSVLSRMDAVHDQNPSGLWIPARRQPGKPPPFTRRPHNQPSAATRSRLTEPGPWSVP